MPPSDERPDFENALFLRFLKCWESGDYFEAHEAMEELWKKKGRIKNDLYRGLTQLAVSLEHAARKNRDGAASVFKKARENIQEHAARWAEIQKLSEEAYLYLKRNKVIE